MKRIVSILIAVAMLTVCVVGVATNVFAEDTYTKVTSADEITTGKYVLVAGGYALGVFDNGWVTATELTADGSVTAPAASLVWTVTKNADGTVKLTDANSVTVAPKGGNKNGIIEGDYSWTFTFADGTAKFAGTGDVDTVTLASNVGSDHKFRAYKNGTISGNTEGYPCQFTMYKLGASAGTPTTPSTGADLGTENADAVYGITVNATVEGTTATVKIGFKDVTVNDISVFGLDLYYDATKVEPTVKNDGLNKNMMAFLTKKPGEDWDDNVCKLVEAEGRYELAYMSTAATTALADGNAEVTVTFTVKEGAEGDLTFYVPHASVTCGRGLLATSCKGNGAAATVAIPAADESSTDTSSEASSTDSSSTTEPAGDTYVKVSTLKNGDKVIVYNPANGVAMSQEDLSEKYPLYRKGVEVTVADNKITTADATIVWTVNVTDAGIEFVSADGKKLSCTGRKLFLDDTNTDTVWTVSDAATEGCVYITSTTGKGESGDAYTIEWYAKYNEFSTFYYGENDEGLFAMQLFALEDAGDTSTDASAGTSSDAGTPGTGDAGVVAIVILAVVAAFGSAVVVKSRR